MLHRMSQAVTVVAALALTAQAASAGTGAGFELTGTLRDFTIAHPDMQTFPNTYNKVLPTLGSDGRTRLDPDYYNATLGTAQQSVHSHESFSQWYRDVPGVNISVPYSITLEPHPTKPNVFFFAREMQSTGEHQWFFPLDDMPGACFNDLQTVETGTHNFYFTYELRSEFAFTPRDSRSYDLEFAFSGDDDVWVFINGQLAVDLGGVHEQLSGGVNLDDNAEALGLVEGQTYELLLFFAERHTVQSNFRIETTLRLKKIEPTAIAPLYD